MPRTLVVGVIPSTLEGKGRSDCSHANSCTAKIRYLQLRSWYGMAVAHPMTEHDDPISGLQQFLFLARHHRHAASLLRELVDDVINIRLCAEIDTLG